MTHFFIEDLIMSLENVVSDVSCVNQRELKFLLRKFHKEFPMISFERTNDSNNEVNPEESQFLNNSDHDGHWFIGFDEDNICFVVNLKDTYDCLEIDAFEVNDTKRGMGLGSNVVSVIESAAEDEGYNFVKISPFDTDAINFWEHMEYREGNNGYWFKKLY